MLIIVMLQIASSEKKIFVYEGLADTVYTSNFYELKTFSTNDQYYYIIRALWFRFHEFQIPLAYHNEVHQQMHKRIYH